MKPLSQILKEVNAAIAAQAAELITEAKDSPDIEGAVSNDTHGKLHELLVGKHLNGGKHMSGFEAIRKSGKKESPQQAHDRLKSQIHPKTYDKINADAESAANHLRGEFKKTHPNHTVGAVHWTSKEGDTQKVTGHAASQKEDDGDIYVSLHHSTQPAHHYSIPLKVSKKASGKVPISNPGKEHSGSQIEPRLKAHREKVATFHPAFKAGASSAAERKKIVRNDPKLHAQINAHALAFNTETAKQVGDEHNAHLQSKDPKRIAHTEGYLRELLHANKTPAQKAGVGSRIKHTTYQTKSGVQHKTEDPATAHEKMFSRLKKKPENFKFVSKGVTTTLHEKDAKSGTWKPIVKHRHKFENQADPLSSPKSVGELA